MSNIASGILSYSVLTIVGVHLNAPVEINCRSCRYAKPVENKQWYCGLPAHNAIIPDDFIPKGCAAHISINLA